MDQEDDFSHGIRETEDKELPQKTKKDFVYGIEDVPHISQLILLGLQVSVVTLQPLKQFFVVSSCFTEMFNVVYE